MKSLPVVAVQNARKPCWRPFRIGSGRDPWPSRYGAIGSSGANPAHFRRDDVRSRRCMVEGEKPGSRATQKSCACPLAGITDAPPAAGGMRRKTGSGFPACCPSHLTKKLGWYALRESNPSLQRERLVSKPIDEGRPTGVVYSGVRPGWQARRRIRSRFSTKAVGGIGEGHETGDGNGFRAGGGGRCRRPRKGRPRPAPGSSGPGAASCGVARRRRR